MLNVTMMHTETYEAFKAAGVPDDKAKGAAVAVSGDTRYHG
jgi:hypothetical protein